MKKTKHIFSGMILFILLYIVLPNCYFNIKEYTWQTEAETLAFNLKKDVDIKPASYYYVDIKVPADSWYPDPVLTIKNCINSGIISPNETEINVNFCITGKKDTNLTLNYIKEIRDHCTNYMKDDSNIILKKHDSCVIKVHSSYQTDNLTDYNKSNIDFKFSNCYDNVFNAENEITADEYFTKLSMSDNYYNLKVSDLKTFSDLTQIKIQNFNNIQSDHDFSVFKNLKYLLIDHLDYLSDYTLVMNIKDSLPKGCKFYVYDRENRDIKILNC